jgi:hypothetical protein
MKVLCKKGVKQPRFFIIQVRVQVRMLPGWVALLFIEQLVRLRRAVLVSWSNSLSACGGPFSDPAPPMYCRHPRESGETST